MTRKDYVKLANLFKTNKPENPTNSELKLWGSMLYDLVDILGDDNPRFDEDKFFHAAGLD